MFNVVAIYKHLAEGFFNSVFCGAVICSVLISNAWAEEALFQTLSEVAIYPEHTAPATAVSLNDSTLSAQLNATVSRVDAKVGASVKKGEVLATLDCTDYEINLEIAEAQLESAIARKMLAKAELRRAESLFKKKLNAQQDIDIKVAESQSSAAFEAQQKSHVKRAKTDVLRCVIAAPFEGIITQRLVAVGELVSPGTPVASIVDSDSLELSAFISPNQAAAFAQVDSFSFDFGEQIPVELYNSSGVIDAQNRNIEARFTFPATKPKAGTSGSLKWRDPIPHVPPQMIVMRKGQLGVFTSNENSNTIEFIELPDARPGRPAAATLPLSLTIVTKPTGTMRDGDKLK